MIRAGNLTLFFAILSGFSCGLLSEGNDATSQVDKETDLETSVVSNGPLEGNASEMPTEYKEIRFNATDSEFMDEHFIKGLTKIRVPEGFELLRCFSVFDTAEERASLYIEYTTDWSVEQVNAWFNSQLERTEFPKADHKLSQGIEVSVENQQNKRVLTGRLCSGPSRNYIELYESKLYNLENPYNASHSVVFIPLENGKEKGVFVSGEQEGYHGIYSVVEYFRTISDTMDSAISITGKSSARLDIEVEEITADPGKYPVGYKVIFYRPGQILKPGKDREIVFQALARTILKSVCIPQKIIFESGKDSLETYTATDIKYGF